MTDYVLKPVRPASCPRHPAAMHLVSRIDERREQLRVRRGERPARAVAGPDVRRRGVALSRVAARPRLSSPPLSAFPSPLPPVSKRSELRVEVDHGSTAAVSLVSGDGEIFGSSLDAGESVAFSSQNFAVYTWTGCTLRVAGSADTPYDSDDTPMDAYLAIHDALEGRRRAAAAAIEAQARAAAEGGAEAAGTRLADADSSASSWTRGPTVLVVGPTDVGKSTLCRILAGYAVRSGWAPFFADLDLGQGSLGLPGSISCVSVDAPVDPSAGWPDDAPAIWYQGDLTFGRDGANQDSQRELYLKLVSNAAAALEARAARSPLARASGGLVNTMGWIDGLGYDLLRESARILGADVVLVVGADRLRVKMGADVAKDHKKALAEMRQGADGKRADAGARGGAGADSATADGPAPAAEAAAGPSSAAAAAAPASPRAALDPFGDDEEDADASRGPPPGWGPRRPMAPPPCLPPAPVVLSAPRSAGVVIRSAEYRAESRRRRVEAYFYGANGELRPVSQTLKLADVSVLRAGGGFQAPSSALPLGASATVDLLRLAPVDDLRELVSTVAAVSHAESADDALEATIAGYIYVQDVDEAEGTLTYLAPRAGPLPGKILLAGKYKVYLS